MRKRFMDDAAAIKALGNAAAILRIREDAVDAVQEAFIDAVRSLKNFDISRPFYPWFYVLLRNWCNKITGKNRNLESSVDIEILAPQVGPTHEERSALEKTLRSQFAGL